MELSSSPPNASSAPADALAYYKAQYELLESELADFQASSQELEAELEKDVEAAEKRERVLREKVEGLGFEVEEWKTKYKQAKTEANSAQNVLQKEITTLRDANRTLQLKLRDIEVANDDFEMQARNTSSSLEDLESKFNVSIERGVMLEEEIKIGEQEREQLRIETQRLRDELGDLKIEAEIMQDKLKKQKELPAISTSFGGHSHSYDESPTSTASSPIVTTPPDSKSVSTVDTISETPTPPSPPRFVDSIKRQPGSRTSMNPPSRIRQPSADLTNTPKAHNFSRHPALSRASSTARPTPRSSTNINTSYRGMTNSTSLSHIRSLTAQMQRLEQRVQSARAKLPSQSAQTTPDPSRTGSASSNHMPTSVTIRSRKRASGSTVGSENSLTAGTPSGTNRHVSRISTSGISRLSFVPVPKRDAQDSDASSRPSSRTSGSVYSRGERPPSRSAYDRPPSRSTYERPPSRADMTGTRTPLGHYSQSTVAESRRPRSSVGGNYAALHGHGHSQSVSQINRDIDEEGEFHTPNRRSSILKDPESGIPTPSGIPRRQSSGPGRRTSSSLGFREGERRITNGNTTGRKLSGVGETY